MYNCYEAMQQSSNHNPFDFLEPSAAPTPQVSASEQLSPSSATETRGREERIRLDEKERGKSGEREEKN